MVYVINQEKQPLMPCHNVIARLLLKQGKAKVKSKTPFTIQLLYNTSSYIQDITLGMDTGSSKVGVAAVTENSKVVYVSEVTLRNDISDKLTRRGKYRRTRRSRKTRYRKPRWRNRKNSIKKHRFSPTMTSKFHAHMKEIHFVQSILPISNMVLETANFDPHALKNPGVLKNKWLYQRGVNYGYANAKAYVLHRDNHTCQYCSGKSRNQRLEVHHIVFRKNGGSDEPENLITLCKSCHDKVHLHLIQITLSGKQKGDLKHATQMNSIRMQLLKRIPEARETFGFITKEHRQLLGLPKEHYMDAVVIAGQGKYVAFDRLQVLFKRRVSVGDYQQTKGIRSQQSIPTGKIQGFRKFDKVSYLGKTYFIKGRMSSGYAVLMDIHGTKIDFITAPKGYKTPKLKNCKRITARSNAMIDSKPIQDRFNSSHD